MSEPSHLFAHIAGQGDRHAQPAFLQGGTALSYGELCARVGAAAGGLGGLGLRPGDRVLLLFPNSVEHVVALLAVMSVGGVAVPLDPESGAARLAHVVKETSPRICLVPEGSEAPSSFQGATHTLEDLAAATPDLDRESAGSTPPVPADEVALIRYSSGTTGVPKGVPLSHRQVLWTARSLAESYGLNADHRDYVVSPLAHSGSWQRAAMTLASGGSVVLAEPPLSISAILEDIEADRVTGFYMAPPLLRMLLRAPAEKARHALRTCRSIESGSAPLGAEELRQLLDLAPEARVFFHYGLTECSRAVILDARAHPDKLDTVGRPTPGVELRIVAEDGRPAEPGHAGQILLRGPQLARCYWNRPDLTAERFSEGWFSTGDYGMLDGEGFLTYLGRKDDLITSAAYSFFPAEVEAELGSVEGVAQYLVAGVADPRGVAGDLPWAFVVPADPDTWSPRDFLARARKRLPPYMVPRMVVAVPSLPLTSSGKPDRRSAVALYAPQGGAQHDQD